MQDRAIIADRAEFVDVLRLLHKGHVLVQASDCAGGSVVDGAVVYHSTPTLLRYGLIDSFDNPQGFPGVRYYRITSRGREFATRADRAWRSRPIWQRLAVRLTG